MRYMAAPKYSTPELPIDLTNSAVSMGPKKAPAVPPAAMNPISRLVCSLDEDLEDEAPEHRYQQQVHDADHDVEDARDHADPAYGPRTPAP